MDRTILYCDCNSYFASVECHRATGAEKLLATTLNAATALSLLRTNLQSDMGSRPPRLSGRQKRNVPTLRWSSRIVIYIWSRCLRTAHNCRNGKALKANMQYHKYLLKHNNLSRASKTVCRYVPANEYFSIT